MHPFSSADDLRFLIEGDPVLDTIKLGRHIIHFGFENNAMISWEFDITYVDGSGRSVTHRSPWAEQGPIEFHALLGSRIVTLECEEWSLTLIFDGDRKLILRSDDGPYEAGTISNSARYYVF